MFPSDIYMGVVYDALRLMGVSAGNVEEKKGTWGAAP